MYSPPRPENLSSARSTRLNGSSIFVIALRVRWNQLPSVILFQEIVDAYREMWIILRNHPLTSTGFHSNCYVCDQGNVIQDSLDVGFLFKR